MAEITLTPLPFEEAITFFRQRVPLSKEQFDKLEEEARSTAFTVSGVTALSIIQDIYDEILKALEEGTTFNEFRSSLKEIAVRRGWEGISPYRADNIFRTNIQTAYNVGRYQQMSAPEIVDRRPFWMYDAVNDKRTRPTHLALDQTVRRYDDPFWQTWYPPNGYRCRCSVQNLSGRDIDRRKLQVGQGVPTMVKRPDGLAQQLLPDPGFATNPATVRWKPDTSKYAEPLRKAYEERSKSV